MKYRTINEQYFDNAKTSKKEIDNVKSTLSDFGFGFFTADASKTIKADKSDVYVKMLYDVIKKAEHFINRSNTISRCTDMKLVVKGIRDRDENMIESNLYGKEAGLMMKHYFEFMIKGHCHIMIKCRVVYNDVSFSEYLKFIKGLFNVLSMGATRLSSKDEKYYVEPLIYLYSNSTNAFEWENTKGNINVIVKDTYQHELDGDMEIEENTPYNFQYRGGVNLSHDISTKTIRDFKIGDVLYSTSDGKLTDVSESNVPIGICISTHTPQTPQEVPYANFVSINYMSQFNREHGSIRPVGMPWGNMGAYLDCGVHGHDGSEEHYMGILDAMNMAKVSLPNVGWNANSHVSIPIACVNLYHTMGTKPGNWYLPWSTKNDECSMFVFGENFDIISKTRKSLVGEGYATAIYWSATESNGKAAYTKSPNRKKYDNVYASLCDDKGNEHYVIAYLKVY